MLENIYMTKYALNIHLQINIYIIKKMMS